MGHIDDLHNIMESIKIGLIFYRAVLNAIAQVFNLIDRMWRQPILLCNHHISSWFHTSIMSGVSEKEEDRTFPFKCIEVCKKLLALWKVKCVDNSNRHKKDEAYSVLAEKLHKLYKGRCKKINIYRTNHCKELKKKLKSEKSGACREGTGL